VGFTSFGALKSKGLTFSLLMVAKLNANELAGFDSFFSGGIIVFSTGLEGGGGKPDNFGAVCVAKGSGFCVFVSGFDRPPNEDDPCPNGFGAFVVDERFPNGFPNDETGLVSFDGTREGFGFAKVGSSDFEDKKVGFGFEVSDEIGFDERNEDFGKDPNAVLKEEVDGADVSDLDEEKKDDLDVFDERKPEGCEGNPMGFEEESIENEGKGVSDFCDGIEKMSGVFFASQSLSSAWESWSFGSFSGVMVFWEELALGVGSSRSKGFSGEEKKGTGFELGFSVPMDKVVGVLFEENNALFMLKPVNTGFFSFFLERRDLTGKLGIV